MNVLRDLLMVFLWLALVGGLLSMPLSVVVGSEDGAMPVDQLWRMKAFARMFLYVGGGVAATAACGLYAVGRSDRSRV